MNADDFGQSHGITRGIIEAHERGIVTSTSLMTRWPASEAAAMYAREHPALSVGLHIDLGEWRFWQGEWLPVYTVVPLDDEVAVRDEVRRQCDAFHHLLGRGPVHLNSHQNVHLREPTRSVLTELSATLSVPLRQVTRSLHYEMRFYGQTTEGMTLPQGVTVSRLIELLSALPPGDSVLVCHPGYSGELDTMYQREREEEINVLCDPRVRAALQALDIELCSFHDLLGFQGRRQRDTGEIDAA